jgi:adenylate cyclase
LIDFGSSNGTFSNKRRIQHPIRLSDGDQITIGDQIFKFRQPLAISEEQKTAVMERTLREIESVPCWLLVADIRSFTPLSRHVGARTWMSFSARGFSVVMRSSKIGTE